MPGLWLDQWCVCRSPSVVNFLFGASYPMIFPVLLSLSLKGPTTIGPALPLLWQHPLFTKQHSCTLDQATFLSRRLDVPVAAMSAMGSANRRRPSESGDDRKVKQAKTRDFGDILPHTPNRTLDKVTARASHLSALPLSSSRLAVFYELYDKIQAMRVPPASTSGLESIVGCVKGKRMIEGILLVTIDRPPLAETGQLQKGVLLHGPLGTGKRSLVLAAASKLNGLTIYMVSGAAINDQYYSNDENNINALYAVAAHNAPAIVSIDEIEVLCAEGTILLTALITAIDQCPPNVVTIEVSNLPKRMDEALLSRLSNQVLVPLPSKEYLAGILELKVLAWRHSVSHDEFVLFGRLNRTYGCSRRDISTVACAAREELNMRVDLSPSYYRAIQNAGKEYLYEWSADDPAARAVNGRAEINTRIHGRPTSLKDLVAAVEDMRSNLVHDD